MESPGVKGPGKALQSTTLTLVNQTPADEGWRGCPAQALSSDPPGMLMCLGIEVNTSGEAHGRARSYGRDGLRER